LLTSQPVLVDGSASPANQPCWQQWTLANPPALLAGQQYTFQFVPTQGGGLPDPYLIQIQLPGTYAGGQNYNLGAQGDCAFRTRVNPGGVGMAEQAPWSLRVYPNPAHDRLTVELPDNTEARLRVFDAMGQLVLEAVSHADRTELDLSGLKPGHYVVQVISGEHAGTACILRW
jgi:hypothetical protein